MAIQSTYDAFNPKAADVAPGNYTKLFDSITQYQSESGLGTALKGMANLLDKGLDAANALILNEGRNQVENKIEPIVEDYTKNLEDARDYIRAKTRPIASPEYSTNLIPGPEGGSPAGTPIQAADLPPDNGMDSRAEATPQAVQETDKYLDTLKAGSLQGKISDTYFRGAVANAAKDIRNQFPIGYRPEIDQMISAKMHTVQANPYIESLLHDINTSLSTGKQEKNATLGTLRSHIGIPGVGQIFDDRDNDRISDTQAMYRLNSVLVPDYIKKQYKQDLEIRGEEMKVNTQLAEKGANGIAAQNALIYQSTQTTTVGVTAKQLEDLAISAANGTKTLSPSEADYYATQAESIRQALYNQTLKDLREVRTDEKTGKQYSYESLTSPDFVLNTAKKVADHWGNVRDSFKKGDLSAATFQTRVMDAAKEESQFRMMHDYPDAAKMLASADLLKKYNVPEQMIYETISKNASYPKIANMVAQAKYEITMPDELAGSLPTGMKVTPTFKGQLAKMTAIYEANGLKGDFAPESITDFTKIIDGKQGVSLVNSDDPAIVNAIAHHTFGPGNENAFKYFSQNMYDSKGRLIPGAQALFNRFASEDVVNKIMKYGTAQTKAEYNNFMTITAREDLLREDLPKLKEWVNTPGLPFKLGWDTESKHMRIEDNVAAVNRAGSPELRTRMNQTVNNINMVLDGLKNIATTSGKKDTDIDAYVLAPIMQSLGDIHDMPGLPESLASMIGNAYATQRFQQESQALKDKDTKKKYTGEK